MKLFVGLGNPGKQYQNTRHNCGFMFLDNVTKKLNLPFNLDKQKRTEIAETFIDNEKIIFMKPQTYMNLSGEAVLSVCYYYKINLEDVVIIYDDLDLEVGKIRLRPSGSSAGHKGMQNIIDKFLNNNIKRIRIGISKVNSDKTINYVIGPFSQEERIIVDLAFEKGIDIIKDIIHLPFEQVMSRYN